MFYNSPAHRVFEYAEKKVIRHLLKQIKDTATLNIIISALRRFTAFFIPLVCAHHVNSHFLVGSRYYSSVSGIDREHDEWE